MHILSASAEFDELPVRHNEVISPITFFREQLNTCSSKRNMMFDLFTLFEVLL